MVIADTNAASQWRGGVRGVGGHLALKGTADIRAASPGGGGTADPRVGYQGDNWP